MTPNHKYGIEIEAIFPAGVTQAQVARAISDAGVPCVASGYTHAVTNHWKVVSDNSLNGNGHEIVSPPLRGDAGFEQVEKVSRSLIRLGATVNASCGLHVHVEMRGQSDAALRRLAVLYMENELVIDQLMPNSRRGNTGYYCRSLRNMNGIHTARTARDVSNAIHGVGGSKFYKVNYLTYWRQGTVEFRHHSGTVEHAKIIAWTKACLRMVQFSIDNAGSTSTAAVRTAVATQRPTNQRLGIIYDMMAAPGGTTREAVAARLGRTSMPPLNRILTEAGIAYDARRQGRTEVYTLRTTEVVQLAPVADRAPVRGIAATVEAFAELLGMPADEVAFWVARRNHLSPTAARRVG